MALTFRQFMLRWVNTTIGVVVATWFLRRGLHYERAMDLVWAALLLGILNAFLRPLLMLFSLPLLILTLGLFLFVINALLLYFVGWLMTPSFEVRTFGSAFLGALIITAISGFLNFLTGTNSAKIKITRKAPNGPPGGDGPVIDI